MEDITSSTGQGSQLIEDDFSPFPSSVTLKNNNDDLENFKDGGFLKSNVNEIKFYILKLISALQLNGKYHELNKISGILSHYPTAQDIVFDWLELKAEHDEKQRYASCHTLVGPEISMSNIGQSMASIDDEILRCMETSQEKSFHVEGKKHSVPIDIAFENTIFLF